MGMLFAILLKSDSIEFIHFKTKKDNYDIKTNGINGSWNTSLLWYGNDILIDSNDDSIYVLSEYNRTLRIIKYNSSGVQLWNANLGWWNIHISVWAIDFKNNIYIAYIEWNEITRFDIYLYKFNASGDLQEHWSWIEEYNQYIEDIAIDSNNNVYIYGTTDKYPSRISDVFILKLNSSGYQQKFYIFKDFNLYIRGNEIAIDSDKNILVSGSYFSFDETQENQNKSWIRIYNNSFELKKTMESKSYSYYHLAIDSSDNIITDDYSGEKHYLMKYNSSGDLMWKYSMKILFPLEIILDSKDNIYLSGEVSIPNDGYDDDLYITKITNSGIYDWRLTWGGSYDEYHHGIGIDSNDNIYLCSGYFLLKNPKNNGKPLYNTNIMIFYLALFGISCIISAIVIYYIVKPYFQKGSRYKP